MRLPTHRPPIHPGEILREEFMRPYRITQKELAERIGVSRNHVSRIMNCRKNVDADMAVRLARLFGTSPELWLNGQTAWDLWHTMHGENACELETIKPVHLSG